MNTHEKLTVTGLVATTPRSLTTSDGLVISSFRLASNTRRYDQTAGEWVDSITNWFTITGFRNLAVNIAESVHKGDRLVICGILRIREWEADDKSGTSVEIEADAIGHNLAHGTAVFTRTPRAIEDTPETPDDDNGDNGDNGDNSVDVEEGSSSYPSV